MTQLSGEQFRTTLEIDLGACRPPGHEVLVRQISMRVKLTMFEYAKAARI